MSEFWKYSVAGGGILSEGDPENGRTDMVGWRFELKIVGNRIVDGGSERVSVCLLAGKFLQYVVFKR